MQRLLAIDGNSLGHRAYHSTRADPQGGRHAVTGAVVSMIASVWRHGPYDGLLIAFDHPINRRKHEHEGYKAHRTSDPGVTAALQQVQDDLATLGCHLVNQAGAEADDLLAAAVDTCQLRGVACDLLSSDRDLIALIDHDVRLLRPQASFAKLIVEDRASIRRRWGIDPHQYPDMAALRGDPSDGLEGAVGIGEKTAARLIRDYGSVLELYASISDLPPRIEASLRAARTVVERNLVLMAPLPHLNVQIDDCVLDLDRAHTVLADLGEDAASRRLRRALQGASDPQPPPSPPPPEPGSGSGSGSG